MSNEISMCLTNTEWPSVAMFLCYDEIAGDWYAEMGGFTYASTEDVATFAGKADGWKIDWLEVTDSEFSDVRMYLDTVHETYEMFGGSVYLAEGLLKAWLEEVFDKYERSGDWEGFVNELSDRVIRFIKEADHAFEVACADPVNGAGKISGDFMRWTLSELNRERARAKLDGQAQSE